MKEILILFLIFGILFIIENKSINLLAYYVGMVIIIAFIISNYHSLYFEPSLNINNSEIYKGEGIGYISYILVLVQISALTILFGFIIMLFPKNNTDVLINKKEIYVKINNTIDLIYEKKKFIYYIKIISVLSIILILLLSYYLFISYKIIYLLNDLTNMGKILQMSKINTPESTFGDPLNLNNNTSEFIKKISNLIYSDPSNIIKFMIITLILLFAIIGLFYLLLPTIY